MWKRNVVIQLQLSWKKTTQKSDIFQVKFNLLAFSSQQIIIKFYGSCWLLNVVETNHPKSTDVKFSKYLTFLAHWQAQVRAHIRA